MGRIEGEAMIWRITTLLLCFYSPLLADSTAVLSGTSSTIDSWMSGGSPTTNYGTSTSLGLLYNSSAGYYYNAIVDFDIFYGDTITSGMVAKACTLAVKTETYNASVVNVYKVCNEWTENQVTYNKRTTSNWNTSGCRAESPTNCDNCEGSGSYDRAPPYTQFIVATAGNWAKIPIDTCIINGWIRGDDSVRGFVMECPTSDPLKYSTIYSSESSGNEPWLKIVCEDVGAAGPPDCVKNIDGSGRYGIDGKSRVSGP